MYFRKQEIEMLRKLAGSGSAEAKRLVFARRDPASSWSFCKFTFTGHNRLYFRKQEIEMLHKLAGSGSAEAKRLVPWSRAGVEKGAPGRPGEPPDPVF